MSAEALIFNKIRGSFVDGWGVRTTIFLKGCPLRCKWCCNPEGQSPAPEIRFLAEKCDGCGDCVGVCPRGALTAGNGTLAIDREKCDGCGDCLKGCSKGALELFGERWTAREMFEFVRRDKAYYESSGGGVTIGGGEASMFPDFCAELIALCHGDGIRVAIDTCGFTVSEESFKALASADLLLYDIKGLDSARHISATGADNTRILDNLQKLDSLGPEIIVRIPVIPGHNDSDAELDAIAAMLSELKSVKRVDLICYHQYGAVKYRQLGREYPMPDDVLPIPDERQREILTIFTRRGLNAQLGG